MKIELSSDRIEDLVTILGAAKGVFEHMVENDQETPGVFKPMLAGLIEGCEYMIKETTQQYNTQRIK